MGIAFSIVLSGGTGSRLWPASRLGYPKPFIKLQNDESLIRKTYRRAQAISSELLTITNRDYYFMSKDVLESLELKGRFLLEPFGKNTAPAIALAALDVVERAGSDALLLVLPADHLIQDQTAFEAVVERAASLAKADRLVTFGIVPGAPETGYGYIERSEALGDGYHVKRFVEKPDSQPQKSL